MVKEVRILKVQGNTPPSCEDIEYAISFAKVNNCTVKLMWEIRYSGTYSRMVESYNNAEDILDSLPTVYGV